MQSLVHRGFLLCWVDDGDFPPSGLESCPCRRIPTRLALLLVYRRNPDLRPRHMVLLDPSIDALAPGLPACSQGPPSKPQPNTLGGLFLSSPGSLCRVSLFAAVASCPAGEQFGHSHLAGLYDHHERIWPSWVRAFACWIFTAPVPALAQYFGAPQHAPSAFPL